MPRETGPSSDEERNEQLREALVGDFDRLVSAAKDLAAALKVETLPSGNREAEALWVKLCASYTSTRNELHLRKDSIDPLTYQNLYQAFGVLREETETIFGRVISG